MRSINLVILLVVVVVSTLSLPGYLQEADKTTMPDLGDVMQEVPAVVVSVDSLHLVANEGMMYYGASPFSGFAVKHFDNGFLAEKTAYINGKKQGATERWYASGAVSFKGTYAKNRRHGVVRTWWENGILRSESNYLDGIPHGVQRQWYQSGALFKELNLEQGKEAGLQRAWRENGKLYANYEAVNGRIFGLKRANLCYDLDGETIQLSNQ
jgi:antitoxin component YwqK of YwqJK toxin-antitoxin module